ncbi:MAG: Fic family protein [Candidatus Amulumruptor caecigallinarius]|nr:Fic family protein [Candidatus Amulumruptor caecigallinarius]MCM1396495.1 Fic family protein [Candidatus Amulumruptor caecigallinarius]MCM1453448.1 Fic family protein [bacterium]
MFIHERPDWPSFRWDGKRIAELDLRAVHSLGYLAGRLAMLGFDSRLAAAVEALTNDIVSSSEIEGHRLDTAQVRSSIALRLGMTLDEYRPDETHYVEGVVEMMLDATGSRGTALTKHRLCQWHRALFPTRKDIRVADYRMSEMTVVSGAFGRERVHYRAPSPERVEAEMIRFIDWVNGNDEPSLIVKSAIAHLWFVSIHPFDDGNGRMARALSDMILAGLSDTSLRYYSLSHQILKDKKRYYDQLERTQRGDGDVTEWLEWYVSAFIAAIEDSESLLSMVLQKATFWATHAQTPVSERQRLVLNKYLDGYDAKLTAKNWQKIAGVSRDTAHRDIEALVKEGILEAHPGRVRDVAYSIIYTKREARDMSFSNIHIEKAQNGDFIIATYQDKTVRDKLSAIDAQRLEMGELTCEELAYKHFAYLLMPEG